MKKLFTILAASILMGSISAQTLLGFEPGARATTNGPFTAVFDQNVSFGTGFMRIYVIFSGSPMEVGTIDVSNAGGGGLGTAVINGNKLVITPSMVLPDMDYYITVDPTAIVGFGGIVEATANGDYLDEVWSFNTASTGTNTVTVTNGLGSGNYLSGLTVDLRADDVQNFNSWTGDVSGVANVNSAVTTLTMPSSAVNITANSTAVGIAEKMATTQIALYPNPASEQINIKLPENFKLSSASLVDVTGKELLTTTGIKIDVSTFPEGIYFVKITATNNETYVHKVTIQ